MNELLRVKIILETQIASTEEMLLEATSRLTEKTIHLTIYIKELEAKIQAWSTTLKLVENEIMLAEKHLEEMGIFQNNTEATYFG